MDIFEERNIAPMLIGGNRPPFDSKEHIYELKLDGIRCIAYLSNSDYELRNKRLNAIYPELEKINTHIKARCILDGELLILNEGKPDFFELQRRSLMTNTTKIELAAKKLPVCFTAFDILYYDDKQITDLPLMERKTIPRRQWMSGTTKLLRNVLRSTKRSLEIPAWQPNLLIIYSDYIPHIALSRLLVQIFMLSCGL
jgi:hypothetical protein